MADPTKERAADGQFPKGQSGNPGGRPRDEQKVAELARSYTREVIDTLVDIMRNGKDERVRGTAAMALLAKGRGCGRRQWVCGGVKAGCSEAR